MLSKNEAQLIYETLLTSPGMNDEVKINLRITRKNVLLLSKIMENGLLKNGTEGDGLLSIINGNALEEIKAITGDILTKAGLTETYNRINALQNKS